jgi:hypothetical protein
MKIQRKKPAAAIPNSGRLPVAPDQQTCPDGMPIRPYDPKIPVMYDDGSRMVLPRKKS